MCKFLGYTNEKPHHALHDARAAAFVVSKILPEWKKGIEGIAKQYGETYASIAKREAEKAEREKERAEYYRDNLPWEQNPEEWEVIYTSGGAADKKD